MKRTFTFAVFLLLAAVSAFAQAPQEPPSIMTQGDATVRRAADIAWVHVAVEARGSKPDEARRQAASVMTAVTNTLKQSVPQDAIRTSSFSLEPQFEFRNNRQQLLGYVVRNQLEVRVDDLEKLSAVLDASIASGATSIAGLRFDVKDRDKLELQALELAVQDAMSRAEAIARGAKRTAGSIIRIIEQRTSVQPMYRTMAVNGGSSMAQPETPITPGEVEIRAQVSATVGIK